MTSVRNEPPVPPGYFKLCSTTLSKLIRDLETRIEGTLEAEDDEHLHQARVVSRRMRSALAIFEDAFQGSKVKDWRRGIRKITRSLGAARDMDIRIRFLRSCLDDPKYGHMQTAITFLLKVHGEQREGLQRAVDSSLGEFGKENVIEDIKRELDRVAEVHAGQEEDARAHACEQITLRIDLLLELERSRHDEDDDAGHHEMRIAAKRLRYTMEILAPLFDGGLAEEVRTIKQLQDVLGDLHDCVIWIEDIAGLAKRLSKGGIALEKGGPSVAELEDQLSKFLRAMGSRRRGLYNDFALLWDGLIGSGFFDRLEASVRMTAMLSHGPNEVVAVISDVHGNLGALHAVLADAKGRGARVIIDVGDHVGFGPRPNQVVKTLSKRSVIGIRGNYDAEVLERKAVGKEERWREEKQTSLDYAYKALSKGSRAYLRSLPRRLELNACGRRVLLVHGDEEWLKRALAGDFNGTPIMRNGTKARYDLLIFGHTHEQLLKGSKGLVFLNPGSVGRPNDGDHRAAYALLSLDTLKVEMRRVEYEVSREVKEISKRGLPLVFALMLTRGRSLDRVMEQENGRKRRRAISEDIIEDELGAIEKVAAKYGIDQGHPRQVLGLTLDLFDRLRRLHGLGLDEKYLLGCAVILHDIGWSIDDDGHHKSSMVLILKDHKLPFTHRERSMVASIARYHRGRPPKKRDFHMGFLSPKDVRTVDMLSAILRVADGLDASHTSTAGIKDVRISPGQVTIIYRSSNNIEHEVAAVDEKKDMFENVFKRKLVLKWK